jgi:hypothetical protein
VSVTYKAQISRAKPACVVILLDQSWSMNDPFGDSSAKKSTVAAGAVNKLIMAMVRKSTKVIKEGPRHYFDIAVLGYGQNGKVLSCLPGTSRGSELIPIELLARTPLRVQTSSRMVPDGTGGQVERVAKIPVWFDPIASSNTPMLEAFANAYKVIKRWAAVHQDSYPPIVINITDGKPNEDPAKEAKRLGEVHTDDGSALLYNIHISGTAAKAIRFPATSSVLSDEFARMLFDISSVLPDKVRRDLRALDHPVDPGARGLIFNADPVLLVQFLEVGTNIIVADD